MWNRLCRWQQRTVAAQHRERASGQQVDQLRAVGGAPADRDRARLAVDVHELARIRFPMWLKSVYNIAQMELTTLDVLGAFYLVALDADWELRPENILANNRGFRPQPSFTAPTMYGAQAGAAAISAHTFKIHAFELQQRTKSDLHAAILLVSVISR